MTADAHHLTQPTVQGPARAMRGALREAGIAPESVGYINAHGTGTPGNDPVESSAIREVFGAHADKIGVSSLSALKPPSNFGEMVYISHVREGQTFNHQPD